MFEVAWAIRGIKLVTEKDKSTLTQSISGMNELPKLERVENTLFPVSGAIYRDLVCNWPAL
jgi:hypothetical protein